MKRPTQASLKKVTPENLAALGVERLAEILVSAAQARPDLKRRLRMELAAEQGADHLAPEIDKRLASLDTSRGKISWRQRPAFVRDLDGLRMLIVERLAALDRTAAISRLLTFMGVARRIGGRLRDRDGSLAAVFDQASTDLGRLLAVGDVGRAAEDLTDAIVQWPTAWERWLPAVLQPAAPGLAAATLRRLRERRGAQAGWVTLIRQLAVATGDAGAYQATFTHKELLDPSVAAEVAQRMLASDRIAEAAALLEASRPVPDRADRQTLRRGAAAELDFDWETAWIEVLERTGRGADAQAARWGSFERTLSVTRARDFTRRLADFDDVEAESRAFAYAAEHADARLALQFLMDWPALAEAAQLIQARPDDIAVSGEDAELWAAKLRPRQPAAAHLLLRKAAAAAFRRREFAICDRLTAEADAIDPPTNQA
ncbi:DUF6880 family protein [Phenylobacterium sp.]|uniref:DUF6880 family protein n=1 Tax=Phenylobacterium sp. TaxID=1871053 RepID=UPI001226A2CB|nr:DUF6880 family protein [Phenylobacterium sp.]THD63628.1 MAG: hypothetical protein E8A12_08595 [Phenylobacterium sp.]